MVAGAAPGFRPGQGSCGDSVLSCPVDRHADLAGEADCPGTGHFLLKEIFAYDYYELAEIFDKTSDSCRQIFRRAKENLGKDLRRFEVDMKVHEKMLNNFMLPSGGSMQDLIDLLKRRYNAICRWRGRHLLRQGQRLTALESRSEEERISAGLLLNVIPQFRETVPGFRQETTFANGLPSIISYSGHTPLSLLMLEQDGAGIRNIMCRQIPKNSNGS